MAPLLQRLEPLVARLKDELANPVVRAVEEPDFVDYWASDLLAGQREDLEQLAALFDEEFHRSGRILVDGTNAEPVIRACAALRLKLRETELGFANDAQLESGEPDFEAMSETDRLAYSCYVVLATLQEIIINNLDLSLGSEEWSEDDLEEDEDFPGDDDDSSDDSPDEDSENRTRGPL